MTEWEEELYGVEKKKKGFFEKIKGIFKKDNEDTFENMMSEPVGGEYHIAENGSRYQGDMKNGKRHGKGYVIYASGNTYKGEFKNGVKEGKGEFLFADGERYVGEFHNDIISGKGKFWHNTGAVYEGEYKNGKREGKGVMTYKNGGHYEGEWFSDKKNGHGKEYYAKEKIYYEGSFQMGLREGFGEMRWPDGHVYRGNFSRDKMNGYGEYDYGDGRMYKGIFVDDQRVDGEFTHKDSNGKWITERYTAPKKSVAPPPQSIPSGGGNLTITLVSYPYERKMEMIKHVREITGLGLKQAKDIVEGVPSAVMKNASKMQADLISQRLRAIGGVVEIK